MAACGLDFGTSNTTLGTVRDGRAALLPLEDGHLTVPSAVFYAAGTGAISIGRAAIDAYVEGRDGRLMRSIKSVLGSSLIDEVTQIGRVRAPFRQVVTDFLRHAKSRAERAAGHELTDLVHGRPVHFVDDDPEADRKAEDTLRTVAAEIGFRNVVFQFEPIAAALDYEQQVEREELSLIADIGGGTSDFSIVRLGPERRHAVDRSRDILANDGVRIGGTDFDRRLSLRMVMPLLGFGSPMKKKGLDVPSSYFHDLATWSSINRLYDPKLRYQLREVRTEAREPHLIDRLIHVLDERRGHTLAGEVEAAKIELAEQARTSVPLEWIEAGLSVDMDRDSLVTNTAELAERIAARIATTLRQAGVTPDAIQSIFLTGGSTRLAHVRSAIASSVPGARIVEGDIFGSVGMGLAIDAGRKFGA